MYLNYRSPYPRKSRFPWRIFTLLIILGGGLFLSERLTAPLETSSRYLVIPAAKNEESSSGDFIPLDLETANDFLQKQDYSKALLAYQQIILTDPHSIEAYLGLAESYLIQEDYPNALLNAQNALVLSATNIRALALQAYIQGMMGDYQAAESSFAKIAQKTTFDGRTYAFQALVLLKKTNDKTVLPAPSNSEILTALNAARQYAPTLSETRYASGLYFEYLGQPTSAVQELLAAHQLEPKSNKVLLALGRNQQLAGDYAGAIVSFQLMSEQNQNDALPYVYLARTYSLLGNFSQALTMAEKAVALNPKETSYYGLLGVMQYYNQRYNEALNSLEIVTNGGLVEKQLLAPLPLTSGRVAEYYTVKGLTLAQLGQCSAALKIYQELLTNELPDVFVAVNAPEIANRCRISPADY